MNNKRLRMLNDELGLNDYAETPNSQSIIEKVNNSINADPVERRLFMRRKYINSVLVAALILSIASLTVIAATLGWHHKLIEYFNNPTSEQMELMNGAFDAPMVSGTDNGYTVNVLNTLADKHGIYVLYELVCPPNKEINSLNAETYLRDVLRGLTISTYFSSGKRDFSYLGRFSLNTILELEGMGRILTVIARGYLFHDKKGNVLKDDAYSRIEYAKNALCAWCSIPGKKEVSDVNFAHLSDEFPELVSPVGEGWFYAHIKGITKFAKENPSLISASSMKKLLEKHKEFTKMWTNKVKQMQVPPFALNTKGAWVLRFDDIIADALELGTLRTEETSLPQDIKEKLESIDLNGVPFDVVSDVICFCIANKRDNTDWVHLPVANFDCYYGNTNFSKKWLSKIPDTIIERELFSGVSRVKLKI